MVDTNCCNENKLEQIIPSTAGLNYISSDGRYDINQAAVFREEFTQSMFQDFSNNPLSEAVRRYGSSFYEVHSELNNFLKREDVTDILNDANNSNIPVAAGDENYTVYQTVNKRIERGAISPYEVAAFIKQQSYDPSDLLENLNNKPKRVLSELDDFFRDGFMLGILGGLCNVMPKIFGAIDQFFDIIGSVGGLVQDALGLLSKIKNIEDPLQALFEAISVKALIESIKNKIEGIIESKIQQVKKAIENFSPEKIINNVETFINENVIKRILKTKEQIMKFFSKENIENIKNKIKSIFDYAAGLFANPSLEEIQFLIARFCGFLFGVEEAINGLKRPLDSFGERFNFTYGMIRANSNYRTAQVVASGGERPAPSGRRPAGQPTTESLSETWYKNRNVRPVSDEERRNVPNWETITSGNHPLIYMNPNARPVVQARYGMGEDHWYGSDIDSRAMLMRVLETFGEKVTILSAYRSPEYNNYLRSLGVNAAPNSQHCKGKAFDIANPLGTSKYNVFYQEMFRIARSVGFGGIGKYTSDNFVHIDLGSQRSWGS